MAPCQSCEGVLYEHTQHDCFVACELKALFGHQALGLSISNMANMAPVVWQYSCTSRLRPKPQQYNMAFMGACLIYFLYSSGVSSRSLAKLATNTWAYMAARPNSAFSVWCVSPSHEKRLAVAKSSGTSMASHREEWGVVCVFAMPKASLCNLCLDSLK